MRSRRVHAGYTSGRSLAFLFAALLCLRWPNYLLALDARLGSVQSFALALGSEALNAENFAALKHYDLVVVDGEEASRAEVAELRASGVIVLAYLSVGTIEKDRWWYRSVLKYRLGFWEDWGEWWADVAQPGYRRIITRRVAPRLLSKGFDGLFLDNVDMIERFPHKRRGMQQLVATLSSLVRRHSKLLFTQNGDSIIQPLAKYLDGWNREDVSFSYDFEAEEYVAVAPTQRAEALLTLQALKTLGLLVTVTDYTASADPVLLAQALASTCSVGAVPFVSDIELNRISEEPAHC